MKALVIELNNSLETNIIHTQDCEFKIKEINDYSNSLYVSDDIFIIGYPKGITDYTMQPIWKRATIATAPHMGWEQQEQFLVKGNVVDQTTGKIVFVVGRPLFDYLYKRIRNANLRDLRQHNWTLCLLPIKEKTEQEIKILEGMEQVREKLIAFKKRMNSELVILQDNKVIRVKP